MPDLIVRLGGLPVSKPLQQWLAAAETRQVVIHGSSWSDPDHHADLVIRGRADEVFAALPDSRSDAGYLENWQRAQRNAAAILTPLPVSLAASEAALGAQLGELLPDGAALFLSNSMPIRDADAFSAANGKDVRVFVNRGGNGIDGIVSTAVGCAMGSGRPLLAVVGDLALQHDANGLAVARDSGVPGVIIVVNNSGGAIFSHLEARKHSDAFETYFTTPQHVSIPLLTAAYGLPCRTVTSNAELRDAVADADGCLSVIEFQTITEDNVNQHEEIRRKLKEAVCL